MALPRDKNRPRPWTRHLEGWQPAVVAVFLAGSAALIAVPRPVDAVDVPEPVVDPKALVRVQAIDRSLAAAAARETLDADVRALGSAIRDYGRADAEDQAEPVVEARARVVEAFGAAMRAAPEHVLRLRAWQLATFLTEVHRWEATGDESMELRALAGGFLRALRRSGWTEESTERRRVDLDNDELATLFKRRWNEVAGATGPGFELSIDEQRVFYRFLLRHPPATAIPFQPDESRRFAENDAEAEARAAMARAHLEQYRLRKVDELAALDTTYQADLARGVVLYRMGRYPAAAEKFRQHLEANPDGPSTLRAQNYLRAALGRARDEQL